jgi:hypothetical protein
MASPLLIASCLLAATLVTISYLHPRLSTLGTAVEAVVLTVWLVWLARRPDEPVVKWASLLLVVGSVIVEYLISWDLWSLVIDLGVSLPCLRYLLAENTRTAPTIAHAPGLTGTVEYDKMRFSDVLVEEYSPDWSRRLGEARTDTNGHFALPCASDGGAHYLKVSWPGTETLRLQVLINAAADPLLLRLKPRTPRKKLNWGD